MLRSTYCRMNVFTGVYSQCRSDTTVAGVPSTKLKKKIGKMGTVMEKKVIPAVEDAEKLASYVCGSNILKEGTDIALKPDSEYPEWLWTLYIGKPKKLEELDPDSKEYWLKVRKMARVKHNLMSKLRRW